MGQDMDEAKAFRTGKSTLNLTKYFWMKGTWYGFGLV